jgi:hypothetical protein
VVIGFDRRPSRDRDPGDWPARSATDRISPEGGRRARADRHRGSPAVINAGLLAVVQFIGILSINSRSSTSCPSRRSTAAGSGRAHRGGPPKRLPAEREALIYLTGFALLIALVILISIQDIQRLITGG